jgi:hypothetical protein
MQRHLVERELTNEGVGRAAPQKNARRVTVNLAESPLTWLHARGHISDREYEAGERLRVDWEVAQLNPGMTMRWEPVTGRGSRSEHGLNPTERQISARARFDGAVAMAGKGLSDILWRVVCACESVPDAEKALEWPARSGKLVLKLALDRVADFYRLA